MSAPTERRRRIPLHVRVLGGALLVVALAMAIVVAIVEHRQRGAIVDEVQRRGMVLARSLAASSRSALLLYDFSDLERHASGLAEEADVVYAMILDRAGRVAAHSRRPEWVGTVADDPVSTRARDAREPLIQEATAGAREPLYDLAVPIVVDGQRWGVARIGLSRQRMEDEIARTRRELGLLGVALTLGSALAATVVARRIVRPVRQLAAGVAAVARGDLEQRLESSARDEIGELARSFNDMANQLREQLEARDAAHAELRARFAELSDLKRYTDDILGSLASGVVTVDLDERVVTMNGAAEVLTGRVLADIQGRPCLDAFANTPIVGHLLVHTARSHARATRAATLQPSAMARGVPVEITTAPVAGADGSQRGAVAVLTDLTPVRQLEDQLRQAQKMEAIGRLAGGVAHDFNNLLAVIVGYSEAMVATLPEADPRREDAEEVRQAAERAVALTRQLLAFSRRQVIEPRILDLNALVTSVTTLLRRLIGEHITVVAELARDLGRVKGDSSQLEQVLVNLAVNARDAMALGGRLTIETANAAPDRAAAGLPGPQVVLTVTDTGAGMTPNVLAHVFEPFFTTKEAGQGTGLGLATVYGIVQQHQGVITVDSGPGRGTTFRIALPRVEEAADMVPAALVSPPPPRGSETVLLVEDEPGVRKLVRRILERRGYTVLEAAQGGEAVELGTRHPGSIQLLLTDVVMPHMSGREVADRLRESHPGLRVLFMSGYTDEGVNPGGTAAVPGTAFIQKPFSPEALARKVREVLD